MNKTLIISGINDIMLGLIFLSFGNTKIRPDALFIAGLVIVILGLLLF